MSDNKNLEKNSSIIDLLKDLIFINSVIATEIIKITENTSRIARDQTPPESCLKEHKEIEKKILEICDKYIPDKVKILKKHIIKHE